MGADDRARWDAVYAGRAGPGDPSAVVLAIADLLPVRGRALDVAGGAGRHALWLAARGLDVTLIDVSPAGLEVASRAAGARGLSLATQALDLELEPPPAGPWDLILVFHYLQRGLLPVLAGALAPGGVLVVVQPTLRNLERNARPSARFLLGDGELARLAPGLGLEILRLDEGWLEEGRHEARLLARRMR